MASDAIRLDKWLWHARVTKTRSLAQKLVATGKVRVNRTKIIAPGRLVRIGDILTITLLRKVLVYEIAGIAARRGPFSEARELYMDLSEPAPQRPPAPPEAGPRPNQRQRKAIAALRGKNI